jgi:hypothetical protein
VTSGIFVLRSNEINRLAGLTRFLDDGRLYKSNNAAALYTLIETGKVNDIDPQAWLADILARLPDHPAWRIDQLAGGRGRKRRRRRVPPG